MPLEGLWGWVPNISGDPLKDDEYYIQTQIKEYNSEIGKSDDVTFHYDISNNKILASTPDGKVEISIHDKGWICSVKAETKIENEVYRDVWLNYVWGKFRGMLDSCSKDICNCTAMNRLVEADARSVEHKIIQAFIDTLENITDAVVYIDSTSQAGQDRPEKWEERMKNAIIISSDAKTNHIYGTRFLEIYDKKFKPEEMASLKKTLDARCQKAVMVYDSKIRLAEVDFKRCSERIARKSLDTSKRSVTYFIIAAIAASVSAVIAMIAFVL